MSDFHYKQLRAEYGRKLERQVEDEEITEGEAEDLMEDWEAGYGDHMLDMMRDRELDAETGGW